MRSRLTLWALLILSCATPAAAQLASQTALVGTVTDSSGSVLPGASVVAVNAGTRDTYETTTNAEGYYNIQFVRTGTYAVNMYAFDPGAPFGGYKNSGIGRENGPEGIEQYTEAKSILLPFGYTPDS